MSEASYVQKVVEILLFSSQKVPFIVPDAELSVCIHMAHVLCDGLTLPQCFAFPNSGIIDIFSILMLLWESDAIFAVCDERIKQPLNYVPDFLQALSVKKI